MSKPTPGPWLIGKDPNNIISRTPNTIIAEVNPLNKGRDTLLIAAAPEMLEVLELVNGLLRFTKLDRQGEAVHDHVKNIIAKATGGAE